MRNPTKKLRTFHNLPVLIPYNGSDDYHYHLLYLCKNRILLNRMLKRHSKVLIFRFDLHFPATEQYPDPMKALSYFLDQYRKLLVARGLDPQYMIRMEQCDSLNPHFHVFILIDGNNTKSTMVYKEIAERLWLKIIHGYKGLVDYCTHNAEGAGIMVIRPTKESNLPLEQSENYQAAFQCMSYLAKYVPEDRVPSHQRKVFYSLCNR